MNIYILLLLFHSRAILHGSEEFSSQFVIRDHSLFSRETIWCAMDELGSTTCKKSILPILLRIILLELYFNIIFNVFI